MKKKIILGILFLLVIVFGVGIFSMKGDKIAKNVYVKDINIGKLTKDEAEKKLSSEYKMEAFNFKYKDKEWNIEPKTIDVSYDLGKTVQNAYDVNRKGNIIVNVFKSLKSMVGGKTVINVAIDFNEDKLVKELEKISKDIDVEVKNATLNIVNDEIEVVKEESGLELDIEASKKNFINNLENTNFAEELVVAKVEPEVNSDDLKNIDTLLASYSTVLSGSSGGRVENIRLATERTSDVLLMPNQEFSYNKHTGEITEANGYKKATVISGGEVAYGIGGGICQVSSTLFNSVLYAGLDIVNRVNHSIPSTYVDLGRDATVTDSGIDFVFKNNNNNPVFIKNYYANGKITCQIFGVKSDKKDIEITTKVNSTIPYKTIEKADASLGAGATKLLESGRTGYSVTTYRTFYDKNGKEIKKETVCSSHYPSKNAVVAVGSKPSSSNNKDETPSGSNNSNSGSNNAGNNNSGSNNAGDNNSGGNNPGESGGNPITPPSTEPVTPQEPTE